MPTIESRGHLYGSAPARAIGVPTLIALFTAAFAVVVLVMGIVPVNLMLGRMVNPGAVAIMWRNSLTQLVWRSLVAALACWIALGITRRARGPLTGTGMLSVGAVTTGALAGALDVGLRKLWIRQMIQAYHVSKLYGYAFALGITAAVTLVVVLLLIARRVRVMPA